jgi:hypothetical protein
MNTAIVSPAVRLGMRRLLPAALCAAAVAIGSTALGSPAIASAEWDVEMWYQCVTERWFELEDPGDQVESCCAISGGVMGYGEHGLTCVAPPAEGTKSDRPLPPGIFEPWPGAPVIPNPEVPPPGIGG